MNELLNRLIPEHSGAVLAFLLATSCFVALMVLLVRNRRIRIKFKGRDREFSVEADNGSDSEVTGKSANLSDK